MKTVTQSTSYQCDGCSTAPVVSSHLPSGWKEIQVTAQNIVHTVPGPYSKKLWQLCATCCQTGNANGAVVLGNLLK